MGWDFWGIELQILIPNGDFFSFRKIFMDRSLPVEPAFTSIGMLAPKNEAAFGRKDSHRLSVLVLQIALPKLLNELGSNLPEKTIKDPLLELSGAYQYRDKVTFEPST